MPTKTMNKVVAACFLALFLLLNAFNSLLFDIKFYNQQYEQNGAYERFGKETALNATTSLYAYLKGEGSLSDFYNDKEQKHMKDVRELVDGTRSAKWMFLGFAFLLIFFIYFGEPDNAYRYLSQVFLISGGIIIGLFLLGLLVSASFGDAFLSFHQTVFTNDLWKMDPATDNMIHLFPQSFFEAFFSRMMVKFLAGGISLAMLGGMLHYFVRKGRLR